MTALAFVDTETTHLDPLLGDAWEIAVIRREQDGSETEQLWQVRVPLETAAPEALEVGRYYHRFAVPTGWEAADMALTAPGRGPWKLSLFECVFEVENALRDAVVVGSNPGFDIAFIAKLLRSCGRRQPWHYRPVDIATLTAGFIYGGPGEYDGELVMPWSSRALSRAIGVKPPQEGVAHTALGDARWARDVYDAVTAGRAASRDPWGGGA